MDLSERRIDSADASDVVSAFLFLLITGQFH